jgi:hypothetical protein
VMGGEGEKALTGHPPGFEHGYEVHHHPAEPVNNHTTGLHGERLRPLMLGRFSGRCLWAFNERWSRSAGELAKVNAWLA